MKQLNKPFEFDGVTLKAVKSRNGACTGCYFRGRCIYEPLPDEMICVGEIREDLEDVIFEECEAEEVEP